MAAEFQFWFALVLKMAVTGLFVTLATVVAERLGPTVGALVATLPVQPGPFMCFWRLITMLLSFRQAQSQAALNAITAIYVTIYVLLATSNDVD